MSFFPHAQTVLTNDSVESIQTRKERKAENKAKRKYERENFKQHFLIGGEVAFATVNSTVRFELPYGIFSAKLDLERHLGLENNRFIYSNNFIYRITPRSGVYAYYYQISRSSKYVLKRDIVFLDDTLKSGIAVRGSQNTNVFSFGYVFSILREEYAYLGMYFNVYFTRVHAGIKVDNTKFDKSVGLIAPMPSFGILASFKITKWLRLAGGVGVMYLNTYYLGGSLFDAQIFAEFIPVKWLGISLGYYSLDVELDLPVESFRSYINYKINGPTVGLWFRF